MTELIPAAKHRVAKRTKLDAFLKDLIEGPMPDLTLAEPETGNYTHLATKKKVHKRINNILKKAVRIKIGVTGDDLNRRDGKDYRNGWYNIELVYKTSSAEAARLFEMELITKYIKGKQKDKVANLHANRAGKLSKINGYYLIYVVWNKTGWTGV